LKPTANGKWKEKVLYAFPADVSGGQLVSSGVVIDAAGNMYGTTIWGGNLGCNPPDGCGVVFELSPNANGTWTETVLYAFGGIADGITPYGGVILDASGSLYGTTELGGGNGCNVAGCGMVYELTPNSKGPWTETVLHSFSGEDGAKPEAGLIFDAAGNLYGTTAEGGTSGSGCGGNGCGTVFRLAPGNNGKWTEEVLHNFTPAGKGGQVPDSSLIFDAAGNLYGTTHGGGDYGSGCGTVGCGTVFRLTPGNNGRWAEQVLHRFDGTDGASPDSGVIFDGAGNLYGTTAVGGDGLYGTVFEITP
jgi:beta-xylosidase